MGPTRTDVKWAIERRKVNQHIRFIPMNFLLEKVSMAAKCSRMFHRAVMEMHMRRRRNPVRVWMLCSGLQRALIVGPFKALSRAGPFKALSRAGSGGELGIIDPACAILIFTGEMA